MAKIEKIIANTNGQDIERQKVLVFCKSTTVAKRITQHLERRKIRVCVVNDENNLLAALDDFDPEIILMEANASMDISLDALVREIFKWMKTRSRAINELLGSPSNYHWQHSKIVFFESGREMSASGSLSADMADTETMIKRCAEFGEVHNIGAYSSLNFMAEFRPFLEQK